MDETKKGFMQNIGDLSFKKIDDFNFEFSIKILEEFLTRKVDCCDYFLLFIVHIHIRQNKFNRDKKGINGSIYFISH